jgi:protein TonB
MKITNVKITPFLFIAFFNIMTSLNVHSQADSVHTYVHQMPEFEGGPDSMYAFIFRNIRYPALARENGIQGVVVAQFVVDTFGRMSDIKISKHIGAGCDEEVLRVMRLMQAQHTWIPGRHEGKTVKVNFALPITFHLESRTKKKGRL